MKRRGGSGTSAVVAAEEGTRQQTTTRRSKCALFIRCFLCIPITTILSIYFYSFWKFTNVSKSYNDLWVETDGGASIIPKKAGNSPPFLVKQSTSPLRKNPGARYPNGTLGLVMDPSTEPIRTHLKMPDRQASCIVDDAIDPVAFDVFHKIHSGVIKSKETLSLKSNLDLESAASNTSSSSSSSSRRILCMVYTHSGKHDRIQAIVNTWGSQCDGFFAASNVTDLSMNAIQLPQKGPESYGNMWQKVRSMWRYAHDFCLDDYDYFHISGDDSFVVVDNMKAYVQGDQVGKLLNGHLDNIAKMYPSSRQWEKKVKEGHKRPLLLGIPLSKHHSLFPQGGGGYTLNREALKLIGVEGGPLDTILADNTDSREDVFIADLMEAIHTFVADTRDEDLAYRYIPYNPVQRLKGSNRYQKYFDRFDINTSMGMKKFSKETVALHLKGMDNDKTGMDEVIYRTHDIINGNCDGKQGL